MFEEALAVIATLQEREPIEILPPALDALFSRLAREATVAEAPLIEDEIWDIWTMHPDEAANALMQQSITAIASRSFDLARPLLDDLVRAQPLWPEAWNKRATLAFLEGRYADSVRDIRRTLEMEPRHFGALCGFGQICLRHQEATSALIAFEAALRIHPHLTTARIAAEELRRRFPPTVH